MKPKEEEEDADDDNNNYNEEEEDFFLQKCLKWLNIPGCQIWEQVSEYIHTTTYYNRWI